jgi:hypothetical protein
LPSNFYEDYKFGSHTFNQKRIEIMHPYCTYEDGKQFIKVTYNGELQGGEPHGIGQISYDSDDGFMNFKGFATFNKG